MPEDLYRGRPLAERFNRSFNAARDSVERGGETRPIPVSRGVRRRQYRLTPEAMAHLFTQGNCVTITDGLPPGARVVGIHNDMAMGPDYTTLIVEHDSFEEIDPGSLLPAFPLEFQHRVSFEDLAIAEFDFTLPGADERPVYVLTVPQGYGDEQMLLLRRSFEAANIEGRVLVLPNNTTLRRL